VKEVLKVSKSIIFTLVLLLLIIILLVSFPPKPKVVTEYLPVHHVQEYCPTWDEAKARFHIKGVVLLEYMINQTCEVTNEHI